MIEHEDEVLQFMMQNLTRPSKPFVENNIIRKYCIYIGNEKIYCTLEQSERFHKICDYVSEEILKKCVFDEKIFNRYWALKAFI